MKRSVIVWLIVAASLVLVGASVFTGVMSMLNWDFSKLSTSKFETNTHILTQDFENISINIHTSDVSFLPSEDGTVKVVCYEDVKEKHSVSVIDGALVIERTNTKKWYEHIGINCKSPKISVYMPKGEYGALWCEASTGDISLSPEHSFMLIDIEASTGDITCLSSATDNVYIKLSTGDITINNISANSVILKTSTGDIKVTKAVLLGDMSIEVTTGKTTLSDLTCRDLCSKGDTGDLTMSGVISTGKFDIERSTGDVKLNRCDASVIYIVTDTGDVSGSLLSDKIFIANTDTGNKSVPSSVTGGRCEITTDTGDIEITVG